ncbi:MAG: DUF4834 family protein [Eudoraea sp.]|nr:DUF4834 family protein [Eudoraea sp.]
MTFLQSIKRWNCTFDINYMQNMVLLKILLVLIASYYAFSLLSRWLFPKVMQFAANKVRQRMEQQMGAFFDEGTAEEQTRDGTSFTRDNRSSSTSSKDVGEYIDFEEIP